MGFIGKQPSKTAITSSDITDGIVTADKLASDSVTTAKIADNGVTTAKINADAVTDAKIADDVVGSEHLTAGEVDTTALGADAVTGAKIADDAISDEHLDPTAITGQTAETTAADDDLILVSDTSASAALKKMTRSNFVSGVGETNTPAWTARVGSNQTLVGDTHTVINYDTEILDTNSAYDTSTKRFTVPSGQGGTYFYFIKFRYTYTSDRELNVLLYKNGSEVQRFQTKIIAVNNTGKSVQTSGMVELSASDYIEARYVLGENPVSGVITGSESYSMWGGFKVRGS